MHKPTPTRRDIPSVTKVLDSLGTIDLPRPLIVDLVRCQLSKIRVADEIPVFQSIVDLVRESVETLRASADSARH